ncbi:MAG: Transcriptional regulator, MarR family [Labilithrix sp.]|nr:Transcriptional regulator, MarR family [Labilithrix sp.]
MGILPSRLVILVDDLEERGLLERRDSPEDRRIYELHLTPKATQALETIARVGRAHSETLCASLDAEERETLTSLLVRIAEEQGLTPGVHPGFRQMGSAGSDREVKKKASSRRKAR